VADTDAARNSPFGLGDWGGGSRFRLLGALIERALGLTTLNRLYRQAPESGSRFWDAALDALDVRYDLADADLARIPRSGPLVAVANHPFGGLDGLILLSVLAGVRSDVKLMGNYLLGRIPELLDVLLPVDPFGDPSRRQANAAAMRSAIRWVKSGGALAVFPAGEVSHSASADDAVTDPSWSCGVARMVQRTGADVVPVFFQGRNSWLFHLAGRIHPRLRTALLPRELLNQRGRVVSLQVGSCIPASRLARFEEPERMISYLRVRTYALGAPNAEGPGAGGASSPAESPRPVADGEPPDALEREVLGLESSQVLLRSGPFDICIARSGEIPRALREIGRLREIAFRSAAEGSGQPRDLDAFDSHYLHLFAWNRERREIAGAYRAGATDDILPRLGISGLYTSTLFRYDSRLLAQIDPALELGRAFVRPEYQRDYSPLALLWKGIGAFVSRNPRYRMLFGPVSISNSYQSVSRQILAQFLYATSYRRDLGELVAPRNPPPFLRHRGALVPAAGSIVKTLADVGALLSEIESDRKGVPVLVRQYLKLNARLLGFNVDPSFGSVLDGLMLVDLADVDRAILTRYMGPERAAGFLTFHGVTGHRRAS
jgi:putative hemolysin